MAHVQKRDGRWQARYRGPDGRERTKRFDRKVDAERWITSQQADVLRGEWVDPAAGKVALAEYAARWIARMAPTWRTATAAAVANSLNHHVLPVLGRRPLVSLRRSDLEALYASLSLAPSTVATVAQHVGQLLAGAVDDGLIVRNPAARARLPKREASRAEPVPLEVVERIQAALPDWMAVAVPLGLGAGVRQGEASGLTVDRIDFLRRTLRVDRQLVSRHVAEPVLGPPKTASIHRTIPLARFLVDALADHSGGSRPDLAASCSAPPLGSPSTRTASATSGGAPAIQPASRASATTPCVTPSPRCCYRVA